MAIEAERHLEFHCDAVKADVLLVRHLSGSEQLSDSFRYVITLYSADANLKAEDVLGQPVSIHAKYFGQPTRYFSGIACEFGHTGHAGRYSLYRMVMRPFSWLLSRNRECRVFQNKTTLEILNEIVKDKWGFGDLEVRLFATLQPREYCVQYRESDLAFISRLMEEEGIYYFFRHEDGKHTMVLADSSNAHKTVPQFEKIRFQRVEQIEQREGMMTSWSSSKHVQAGQVALLDYDFKKPRADLDAHSADPREHKHADAEIFDYPGHYTQVAVGEDRARVRLQEVQANYEISEGSTDATGLCVGALFNLADHPRDVENRQYLITSLRCQADSGSFETGGGSGVHFSFDVRGVDSSVPYRPARVHYAPLIAGAQTALVVGPKGQEIWTDEYGRIKVQFYWDRKGEKNESSSCWIRVAQRWAGSNWGSLYIPRIGQEVVVEFLEGNPDQPLVTGCVYNDSNRPPYKLPQHQTQSGVKSQSTKNASVNDYNELRFEDSKGAEEIVVHAQRNYTTTVGHDAKQTVNHDLTMAVSKGNYTTTVAEGSMVTEVPKDKYELSAKEISELGQDKIELDVAGCQLLIDKTSITVSVGASSIKLDATGVTVRGAIVTVQATAEVAVTGAMVKINS